LNTLSPPNPVCSDVLKGNFLMAIHTPPRVPTHGGLERVIERTGATRGVLASIFSGQHVPTYVLGLTVMAVVTLTERALDAVDTGFASEWVALSVVALATFGLLANAVTSGTRAAQAWFGQYVARARNRRADEALWATAQNDRRVMNDILAAQGYAEHALLDEATQRKRRTQVDQDDGLAALSPWAKRAGYY
jgi:hypothetical protein